MSDRTIHTRQGAGPHHLMLGAVTVSRLLGGEETGGELSLVELRGLPGSGPGPHVDPWRESFLVLEGELEFRFEEDGEVRSAAAGPGDAVSIPAGVGHAFSVAGSSAARYLIAGSPAGIDGFFADAGEPAATAELPDTPWPFDRGRLHAAFAKYKLGGYEFPGEPAAPSPPAGAAPPG